VFASHVLHSLIGPVYPASTRLQRFRPSGIRRPRRTRLATLATVVLPVTSGWQIITNLPLVLLSRGEFEVLHERGRWASGAQV